MKIEFPQCRSMDKRWGGEGLNDRMRCLFFYSSFSLSIEIKKSSEAGDSDS